MSRRANPTGRHADPRRTLPLTGSAWRKLRERVLARDPICQECYRRDHFTEATDVDHINGDPSDNSLKNLQGLCHSCHSRKTRREMNGSAGVWGCDVNGYPLDPDHPWNIEERQRKSLEAERA
ncbi:HNH endonuclease [Alcaligenes sp. SDU_A2]|uniref:HNH endonuclease n=1 Tax=Alcaligenes sp. SDU_A2 TaxID=3136634 RepID=UPI0031203834